MLHGGDADPGWFDYPTLVIYLVAPLQSWHEAPSYLSGRVLVALIGVAGVAAAWWLGRASYGALAGWVAAAAIALATVHVAYSRMAVTDVPLTVAVTVTLALLVTGRLEWAGVGAGLAVSAKYPGVFLAVPLLVAGWRQWRRLGVAVTLAVAAFAATSPFAVVHAGEALADARRVQSLAREGWLGFENDHPTPIAFLDRLWEAVGPLLVVSLAGLAVALARRSRADLVLASFVLVYYADLLTLNAHFDRYVLPLLPPLAVLAARVRLLAPVALAALTVPLVWTLSDNADLRKTDTRLRAHAWIERNVPPAAEVAADPSTPALPRQRVTRLSLPGPGRPFDPRRDVGRLRAEAVAYVFVTGAVTDRVRAARDRYPREARFYDALERETRRVFYVESGGDLSGPWVAVYRL